MPVQGVQPPGVDLAAMNLPRRVEIVALTEAASRGPQAAAAPPVRPTCERCICAGKRRGCGGRDPVGAVARA